MNPFKFTPVEERLFVVFSGAFFVLLVLPFLSDGAGEKITAGASHGLIIPLTITAELRARRSRA